jgi:MFS family permease
MQELALNPDSDRVPVQAEQTVFAVILAVSFCHLLNDMMQSLLPAIYPTLKVDFGLSFGQVGIVTLAYQITASILQPLVGLYADRRPTPLALPGGTLFSLAGLVVLSIAHRYGVLLIGASLLGVGSSIFHPESSRVVRMAAGGRPGLGQSLFQVGGNLGQALGPLAAALVVVRWGQSSLAFFSRRDPLECRDLVQAPRRGAPQGGRVAHGSAPDIAAWHGAAWHERVAGPGVFEIHLPGKPDELLHILFDASFRPIGA